MKIRTGFVSNSSSSSFILSIDTGKTCPTCGRNDSWILNHFLSMKTYEEIDGSEYEPYISSKNKKEVLKELGERWYLSENERTELAKKIRSAKGTVISVGIPYGDEKTADLIENNPRIEILHGES